MIKKVWKNQKRWTVHIQINKLKKRVSLLHFQFSVIKKMTQIKTEILQNFELVLEIMIRATNLHFLHQVVINNQIYW